MDLILKEKKTEMNIVYVDICYIIFNLWMIQHSLS